MAQQIINVGAAANDGTGDTLRGAFIKTDDNFDELYTGKENTITAGTTSQYYRGDKTFQTLNKSAVGLGNVDNTSDANKPVSTATQTALNAKIGGSGTTNYVSKFTASGSIGNSLIFDNGSSVGIGTTSPSEKLEVQNGAAGAKIKVSNSGGGSASLEISSNASSVAQLNFTNSLTMNGGNVTINGIVTATAFIPTSDIRLKDLIDYNYNVNLIKPITYTWKDNKDKRKKIGYSAQQIQEFLPEVVNTDDNGMLSVDYNQIFVAKIDMLENLIQELKSEIEILKTK